MAQPTTYLRQVQKEGGLVLQQWFMAEGWEHETIVENSGYWEDVPVLPETDTPPLNFAA